MVYIVSLIAGGQLIIHLPTTERLDSLPTCLIRLDEMDLLALGVRSVGHRKRLLQVSTVK